MYAGNKCLAQALSVFVVIFLTLSNTACSARVSSMAAPGKGEILQVSSVTSLVPKLEDVALTQESRLAGYIASDNRLVIVNVGTGEEIWWRNDVEPSARFIPYNIRDGLILRSQNDLQLFLLNGGRASMSTKYAHLVNRGSNETQFISSFEKGAEIINLLDANPTTRQIALPHDANLFAKDAQGIELPYSDSIHTFFASPTNDVLISLDLLLLRFAIYNATGLSGVGATQFSPQQYRICSAADLNTVSELLLSSARSNSPPVQNSKAVFDPERLPVSYALDSGYKGILLKIRDGRLIHLDFAVACAGGNAISVLDTGLPTVFVGRKETILPLQASTFALQARDNKLEIYKVTKPGIVKTGTVENVCTETILTHRLYDKRLLLVCGNSSSNGLAISSLASIQLIDLDRLGVISSIAPSEGGGVAGMAFDNSHPKLFVLSNRSMGMLATFDFSDTTARQEVKTNFILKNILDKL